MLDGDEITIDLDEVLYMDSQPDGTAILITETDLVYCVRESPEANRVTSCPWRTNSSVR